MRKVEPMNVKNFRSLDSQKATFINAYTSAHPERRTFGPVMQPPGLFGCSPEGGTKRGGGRREDRDRITRRWRGLVTWVDSPRRAGYGIVRCYPVMAMATSIKLD